MKKRVIAFIAAAVLSISFTTTLYAETLAEASENAAIKTGSDYGLTEEQLSGLVEAIKETVTAEYLEPEGIDPADFEWESPAMEFNEEYQCNLPVSVFWNGFKMNEVLTHVSIAVMASRDGEDIPELPDNANLEINGTYDLMKALYRGITIGIIQEDIQGFSFFEMPYNEEECIPVGQFIVDNVKFE